MAKRTEIDKKLFERLCFLMMDKDEICQVLGVSEKALNNWCKRTYDGRSTTQIIGWKKIKIDQTQFTNLCRLQCTLREVANFFGCSDDTINRWCKETFDGRTFSEVFAEKRMDGIVSVRRAQFDMAHKIPSMSIWWGKQYLGQRDPDKPVDRDGTGAAGEPAGGPVAFIIDDIPAEEEEDALRGHEAATWGLTDEGLPVTAETAAQGAPEGTPEEKTEEEP